MTSDILESIQAAFDKEGTRFIVVGGLATIAHGYLRATTDIDIVIDLVPESIERAFAALESIGYKPHLPITAKAFSNPETRHSWATEKNMTVLQFWSEKYPVIAIDLFVEAPFDFRKEWETAYKQSLTTKASPIHFVSLASLIAMKEKAGRPQDLADLEHLRSIQEQIEPK
ncbi:DUF6036 family nucleotidyltransferase [Pelagicoccus sp. SDUM812005]|uniref:DUF6036 family nucleotidyltransferase n=1 Tax=Pelagicoccus sp. SDUM812005 TaxID=3041257 RepID=UPI00280DFD44|nr:DUF6036 family nucleotidyltransferase [Pelagicoccus sp. SDUM812005]MDQ8182441.1 hypothetical protein [Pelagicoccus sp. SDUM812005]